MPHVPDSNHPTHDLELIATAVAADAPERDRALAAALIERCPDCATLHADLVAIAAAMPTLPSPVRHRDFQLTDADAARLRPGGLRGVLRTLSGPRFAFAAPLGAAMAALGIVAVLAGPVTAPTAGQGGDAPQAAEREVTMSALASGPAPENAGGAQASAAASGLALTVPRPDGSPGADAGVDTMGGRSPAAVASDPPDAGAANPALTAPSEAGTETPPADAGLQTAATSPNQPLLLPGASLLLAGVLLLVIRLAARTLGARKPA
jgi:hypothetical protein